MNTDIRLSVTFRNHRKRKKLQMLLGAEAVICLIDLWIGTAMSRPKGLLTGWDELDIALEAGWTKEPGEFVEGLIAAGFLERGEDGVYALHGWEEHQSWAVEAQERSESARAAAKARWAKGKARSAEVADASLECPADADAMRLACVEHAAGMRQACESDAPGMRPACEPQCPSPILSSPEEERQGEKDNARARVDRPPAPEVLPPELPEDEPTAPVQGLKTKRASSDPACYAAFQRVVSLWPDRKEIERAKRAWNALWEAGEIIPHAIEDAILDHKARDAEWADGCHPRLWRWLENRRWTEQPKERPAQAARASPSSAPPSPTRYQDLRDLEQRQERERMRAMKEQLDAESRSQADQGQPQRVQSAPHAESAIQPGRPGRPLPVDGGRPGRKALA